MRWFLAAVGLALWAVGVYRLAAGAWDFGGALVIVGGVGLILAAAGGWAHAWEGLTNWLYFWAMTRTAAGLRSNTAHCVPPSIERSSYGKWRRTFTDFHSAVRR